LLEVETAIRKSVEVLMQKKTHDALRRADCALAGAALLMLVSAGATAAYTPSTEQLPAIKRIPVQTAAQLPAVVAALKPFAVAPSAAEIAMAKMRVDERCLADAMYYEARGEGVEGQEAVAEVVFHRMRAGGYPGTICGVVYEGSHLASGCQFSFACDGATRHAKSWGAWLQARRLAARIVAGRQLGNITGGATSFHAVYVQPSWADTMARTVQIGNHIFYRPLAHTGAS
jgi:spore germination cell wall hydrolase CwlJ-like protein